MAAWRDPILPTIPIPENLDKHWFHLGDAVFQLLPKQFEFIYAQETFLGFISGYGGGKTRCGAYKAGLLSCTIPGNRGLVGRLALPDLEQTAQRDLLDFLETAKLLKESPNSRTKTAVVYCVDPADGRTPLGLTSEITFQHMDDPDHLRGRHLGWFWIDEGSEVREDAHTNLIGRLRLPAARGRYTGFVTGNPEGHNWIYDFYFNKDTLVELRCGAKLCRHKTVVECNEYARRKRRGIHCTTFENYYLPQETIELQMAGFSEVQRLRYLEGSFDVFEGQVFTEFDYDLHLLDRGIFKDGQPPREWNRLLACDVGGASPWAFLWVAVDTEGNVVAYDEIYKTTSSTSHLAQEARPKMFDLDGQPLHFQAKVIDYENKVAADDMAKHGIRFTNAQKHGKVESVNRFMEYLHPNPLHRFPQWHPRAGEYGAPHFFIVGSGCPHFVHEIPQQRWNKQRESGIVKDELDPRIPKHAIDACLYLLRELPRPSATVVSKWTLPQKPLTKMSELYWADFLKEKERLAQQALNAKLGVLPPYRISHARH